jgi:Putative serine dehydratase domain
MHLRTLVAFARLGGAPPGDSQAADKAGQTRDFLARHGIECPTITGAGTFEFEAASGVHTELQCGCYIFMDGDYGRNRDRDGAPTKAFEPSRFVWATVMSHPAEDRAIVDAGLKALAFDRSARRDLRARLRRARKARPIGRHQPPRARRQDPPDPGHCDPTVNLYDWYVCIRNNRVEQLGPITARGAGSLTFAAWPSRCGPRSLCEKQALTVRRSVFYHIWYEQDISRLGTGPGLAAAAGAAGSGSGGHVAHFVRDTVCHAVDLSAILASCGEARGYPPYHPGMMVALLRYGYSQGVYSSRRLARAAKSGWILPR